MDNGPPNKRASGFSLISICSITSRTAPSADLSLPWGGKFHRVFLDRSPYKAALDFDIQVIFIGAIASWL
jgi:hypothetical protein